MRQPVQKLCAAEDTLYYASGSIIKSYTPLDQSSKELWRGGPLTDTDKLKSFSSRAIIALAVKNGMLASVGEDKMLRVFNLVKGCLESERETVKRPSCVVFAEDDKVLVADKFGDVYALDVHGESSSFAPRMNLPKTNAQRKADKRAKQEQKKEAEPAAEEADKEDDEEPAQDSTGKTHLPILGHVSILTDLVVSNGYIITADRDEHVRVSHYPKAYIIEHFLLDHTAFVSALLLMDDTLISGGGDDFLAVWDWRQGTLLGQISLQEPMRMAGITLPTVTRLVHAHGSLVLHLESVPGVFILELAEDVAKSTNWRSIGSDLYHDVAVLGDTIYCARADGAPFDAWRLDGSAVDITALNEASEIQRDSVDFTIPSRDDMRKRTFDGKRKSDEELAGEEKRVK